MATINDIAAKLGVSKSTVSKGLNHATDISEEMRRKILETAVELGYTNKRVISREKKLCILIENMDYNTPNSSGMTLFWDSARWLNRTAGLSMWFPLTRISSALFLMVSL